MELQECINFLLTTAQHTVFMYMSQRLAPYNLTPSQYGVLNCLWMNDSICLPGRIAELLCLETSTVSGILDRMQKKGFIERVVNEENRREVFVKVTGRGQELKGPVLKVIEEINQRFWEDFTEEESDFIRGSLRKIAGKEL